MVVRRENPSDYAEVYALVRSSFATASHADGDEADYVTALRKKDAFVPALSLVAEGDSGELIGLAVLSETAVVVSAEKTVGALLLSPLCVHPAHFRRGVARRLMAEAFRRAARMGYPAVFLCGDPAFYRKMGFVPTWTRGIFHAADPEKNADWCMVLELTPRALDGVTGTVDIQ